MQLTQAGDGQERRRALRTKALLGMLRSIASQRRFRSAPAYLRGVCIFHDYAARPSARADASRMRRALPTLMLSSVPAASSSNTMDRPRPRKVQVCGTVRNSGSTPGGSGAWIVFRREGNLVCICGHHHVCFAPRWRVMVRKDTHGTEAEYDPAYPQNCYAGSAGAQCLVERAAGFASHHLKQQRQPCPIVRV